MANETENVAILKKPIGSGTTRKQHPDRADL